MVGILDPREMAGVQKSCLDCGKDFNTITQFENHRRTHTGEKPYICVVCKEAFALKGTLKRHETTHSTVKRYSCKDCSETFHRDFVEIS